VEAEKSEIFLLPLHNIRVNLDKKGKRDVSFLAESFRETVHNGIDNWPKWMA